MRVTITHGQGDAGFIFSKPVFSVSMEIVFSEEEQAIIKHRNLKNVVLIPRPEEDVGSLYTIGYFAKGKPCCPTFPNLLQAKAFETELRERYLPTLKLYLDGSKDIRASDTFEM